MHQYKDKDLYSILGVDKAASKNDIKAAYRKLARKYHPDVNKGNKLSERRFKEIGEAYEVLVDDAKRRQYNIIRGIVQANNNREQAKKAYSEQNKQTTSKETQSDNKQKNETKPPENKTDKEAKDKPFTETFSGFWDGILKKSSDIPKQSAPKKETKSPVKGTDITVEITITINEGNNGTVRTVNVLHTEPCKSCHGKKILNNTKCKTCDGDGYHSKHKKINVKIPGGVKEGSKVRIPDEGNIGTFGGQNGDLYLKIHIERSELFRYEGLNVLSDIPITPWEAALGTDIQVPTISGNITMKIPPETTSGQKFKLSGEGIVDKSGKNKGDHIITVHIEMPKKLSQAEKELYQGLAKQREFNPREGLYK